MIELGFEFQAMACACELHLEGTDEPRLRRVADAAMAEVRRIERKFSRYDPASVVSRINAAAGSGEAIEVDEETAGLLDFAAQLHALSEGLFDITSGVLRQAWDFRVPRLPARDEVAALTRLVGWPRVAWSGCRIALPDVGMEIDFGGFGKEYAADRVAAELGRAGIDHGYVNLGGDIRVIGPRSDGKPWRLGIQHPRRAGQMLAQLEAKTGALATSGDYERYFEINGRRYCHLLDPRSGWPVSYWQSVSVLAPNCAAAGAVCTIAMLMGEQAQAFLHDQRVDWLAVGPDGAMHGSLPGIPLR